MTTVEISPEALAQAILQAGRAADTEEDLRIAVEAELRPALEAYGLSPPRYERSYRSSVLGGPGSSDAVYGHAVIEYERPRTLRRETGVRHAVEQLKRYMTGEAGHEAGETAKALRRFVGIGLDGERIFFLRYRGTGHVSRAENPLPGAQLPLLAEVVEKDGFHLAGPYDVTAESAQQFLLYLRALRRRPLTPEDLADAFGPQSKVAQDLVKSFYGDLERQTEPRVQTLFSEWDRLFGIVYGQDLTKARKDVRALAKLYGLTGNEDLKMLLFAVHTYYALLMKLLAAELASLQTGSLVSSVAKDLPSLPDSEVEERLRDLEGGGLFGRLGVHNFLEGDFFGWYLSVWDDGTAAGIRSLASVLSEFEPATGSVRPEETRDLLKKLYQYLIPRELRHDLGEYYTPDWLAQLVLDEVGWDGDPHKRLLDPGCGSGTFLVLAIRRVREYAEEHLLDAEDVVQAILQNIVGFDLNPLAVIAARTNYLLALGNWVRYVQRVEIPVYLCDSILTPAAESVTPKGLEHRDDVGVPTAVTEFWVPKRLVEARRVGSLMTILETCVAQGCEANEFVARATKEISFAPTDLEAATLQGLYEEVQKLEREGRNGIWARILKNAFAPMFEQEFDVVAGNPPWVNWESLADGYRTATKAMWQHYGLFSLTGHAARLGGGKKDIAMLMLYTAVDHYLRDAGRLGFVVTQTLLKTKGAGDGFRRFRLGDGPHMAVTRAHDLVALQPFEGASNRTAVLTLEKGRPTEYPVEYRMWRKAVRGQLETELLLEAVSERVRIADFVAEPVHQTERTSPWLTAHPSAIPALRKLIGMSGYRAHAGACTWANGVYWLDVLERRPDGLLRVANLHDVGRIRLRRVETLLEPDLVYPLLRGRDIDRWQARPSAHILMVQDPARRTGIEEARLRQEYRLTYAYLAEFETQLRRRSGFKKYFDPDHDPFYTIYNVSEYTFAPCKVVWQEQASELTAAVTVGADAPTVPDHKLMMVACGSVVEAHFLCAALNSAPSRLLVKSYGIETSTSTHVLENVAVPLFDTNNPVHRSLAAVSEEAHKLAAGGAAREQELRQVETEIDRLAARLWGLTKKDLLEVQRALSELAG